MSASSAPSCLRIKPVLNLENTIEMPRCLSTFDVSILALGAMTGAGIYVLAGVVARDQAGPAVLLSFILAGLVALLSALCLAEFSSLVPHVGSTYLYTYCTLGELPAFLTGAAMVFGGILSASATARAWSTYVTTLLLGIISKAAADNSPQLQASAPPPGAIIVLSVALVVVTTIVIILGMTFSTRVTAIFAFFNITILLTITILGFSKADLTNWTSGDTGGFMPYGYRGMVEGVATCFWAFTGYSIIAVSAGEVLDPRKSIPRASAIALAIVTVLYVSVSSSLTLMTSYKRLDRDAPFIATFRDHGLPWLQYVICLGPLCGMTTSLISAQTSVVRTLFAIASDGLIYSGFAHLNKTSQVPAVAAVFSGCVIAILSCLLDLKQALNYAVVLSLSQYVMVSLALLIRHYIPAKQDMEEKEQGNGVPEDNNSPKQELNVDEIQAEYNINAQSDQGETHSCIDHHLKHQTKQEVQIRQGRALENPAILAINTIKGAAALESGESEQLPPSLTRSAKRLIRAYLVVSLLLAAYCGIGRDGGGFDSWSDWLLLSVLTASLLSILLVLTCACQQTMDGFILKRPLVPVLPCLSLTVKCLLIGQTATVGAAITITLLSVMCLVVYFSYGIHHSKCRTTTLEVIATHTQSRYSTRVGTG